mgnify:CR=1 FL=1|jgi:hypothetical protein
MERGEKRKREESECVELNRKKVKEISEFFGIYIPDLFSIHIVADKGRILRYGVNTFINGQEATLVLPADNFDSGDLLDDDKSLENYSTCIMCAWASIKLMEDNKLSGLETKEKCEIFKNAFEDMNDTHKDLLKPLNDSFLKFIKRGQ